MCGKDYPSNFTICRSPLARLLPEQEHAHGAEPASTTKASPLAIPVIVYDRYDISSGEDVGAATITGGGGSCHHSVDGVDDGTPISMLPLHVRLLFISMLPLHVRLLFESMLLLHVRFIFLSMLPLHIR